MQNILLKEKMLRAGDVKGTKLCEMISAEFGMKVSRAEFSRTLHGKMHTPKAKLITEYSYQILDRLIEERRKKNGESIVS